MYELCVLYLKFINNIMYTIISDDLQKNCSSPTYRITNGEIKYL